MGERGQVGRVDGALWASWAEGHDSVLYDAMTISNAGTQHFQYIASWNINKVVK